MKTNDNTETNKRETKRLAAKTLVIVALAALVAVEAIGIMLLLNRNRPLEETKNDTIAVAENMMELYTITTDTVDFQYGAFYPDSIYAEIDENEVTFSANVSECEKMRLFTLQINGNEENKIGIVVDKNDQEVPIGLKQYIYEGSTKVETAERLDYIRETLIDDIISNLQFVEGPYQQSEEDPFLMDNMAIDTNILQLFYPKKWENNLSITENGNTVTFYCCLDNREPIKLFCVQFHDEVTAPFGIANDIPVGLALEYIQTENDWSEEEEEIVYTMQEDAYVIIDGLVKYNGLSLSN